MARNFTKILEENSKPLLKLAKKSSIKIKKTLEETNESKSKLEIERNKFSPLAQSAATTFFKFQDLQGLSIMYTSGLHFVLVLFNYILKNFHEKDVGFLTKQFITLSTRSVQSMSSSDHEIANCLHLLNGLFPQYFNESEWNSLLQRYLVFRS